MAAEVDRKTVAEFLKACGFERDRDQVWKGYETLARPDGVCEWTAVDVFAYFRLPKAVTFRLDDDFFRRDFEKLAKRLKRHPRELVFEIWPHLRPNP